MFSGGRGVAQNHRTAFTKAGAEAIRNFICNEYDISPHGVAVHTNDKSAKVNAQNELIERDRFFCHYLTQTPFQKISTEELTSRLKGIDFVHIQKKLEIHSIEIDVFEMAPLNWTRSFLCISRNENSNLTLGIGSISENYSLAIQEAIIECLMNHSRCSLQKNIELIE